MSESKTYKMRTTLNDDQIKEALAAFFGVPKKDVYLTYDSEDGVVAMIEKEMQFPEKEKEKEYVYLPVRDYEPWTPAWDPMKPNIVWCEADSSSTLGAISGLHDVQTTIKAENIVNENTSPTIL